MTMDYLKDLVLKLEGQRLALEVSGQRAQA